MSTDTMLAILGISLGLATAVGVWWDTHRQIRALSGNTPFSLWYPKSLT
jgi:hypothetical protein